jgi:hypothetical protein
MGVPCNASRARTWTLSPAIESTSTSWSPIGFGRSADRVLNTPCLGVVTSSRGWTRSTSRCARCSHVRTMTRAPGRTPWSPSSMSWSNTSQASGAPSWPCFGATALSVSDDSTLPIGLNWSSSELNLRPPAALGVQVTKAALVRGRRLTARGQGFPSPRRHLTHVPVQTPPRRSAPGLAGRRPGLLRPQRRHLPRGRPKPESAHASAGACRVRPPPLGARRR